MVLVLVASFATVPEAYANDTGVGARAGRLVALQETRVEMVREEIVLVGPGGDWEVEADYWFRNSTDEVVELDVGFPEVARCECPDCGDWVDPSFRNMRTWVDGEEVEHRVEMVDMSAVEGAADPCEARTFVFPMRIGPGATVNVEHRYSQSYTLDSQWGESIRYVTTTGANWNGPIGSARFTVRRREDPRMWEAPEVEAPLGLYEIHYSGGLEVESRREFFDAGDRWVEIVFAAEDWVPTEDFQVWFFELPAGAFGFRSEHGWWYRDALCMDTSGLYPQQREERLPALTDDQLRIGRNAAFAAHGYPFESADLRAYFYGQEPSDPGGSEYGTPPPRLAIPLMENPDYSDALLHPGERACVEAVRAEEARRAAADD